MSRRPHTQAHLPTLEANEALRFVALLQRIIDAVWRAHGHAMSEQMLNRYVGTPSYLGTPTSFDSPLEDTDDLPF